MCEGRINYIISCLLPKNRWTLVNRKAGAPFWRELLGYSSRTWWDKQFACQNRCEPPPEFPLASPYSAIISRVLPSFQRSSGSSPRKESTSRTSTAHDTQALEICLRSTLPVHRLISSIDAMWSRDFHKMTFKAEIVSVLLMVTLVCATLSSLPRSTTPFCLKMILKALTGLPKT